MIFVVGFVVGGFLHSGVIMGIGIVLQIAYWLTEPK